MKVTKDLYQVLPITFNLWNDISIYDFYINLTDRCDRITHYEDDSGRYIKLTWSNSKLLPSVDNVDKRTAAKILNVTLDLLDEGCGYTVLMPRHVWVTLCNSLNAVNIGRRRSIARVFVYLYYYSMRFQGSFSHSRADMLKELKINNHTLNDSLDWLELNEFIVRSSYSMRPHERYARRYYIPEEYWSLACKKEFSNLQKSFLDR